MFQKRLACQLAAYSFAFQVCLADPVSINQTNALQALSKQVIALIDGEKFSEALPLAMQWLNESEALYGAENTNSAMALSKLGILYEELGNYTVAEPSYEKCLKIREKVLGLEHPDTADAMNDLGLLYRKTGNYETAEQMYLQSLKIREKVLGDGNSDTGDSMNNLAVLYRNMGNYAAAEPLFKKCLAIWEKTLGPDDPATATALNNLANLYFTIGNYSAAEPLYQRSIQIVEKTQGTNHLNTAAALNNLAELYRNMGKYLEAEHLHKRSLIILEMKLGADHPGVATTLNNLAELYCVMGNYDAAEPLYQRCLKIWEGKLGPEHVNTATALNNLAVLYRSRGNYPAAEELLERSLVIYEKVLGEQNSRTASCLNNLALTHLGKEPGGSPEVLSFARKATIVNEKSWQTVLSFASDDQRTAFQKIQSPYLLFANLGSAPDLAEGVLRNKALVLDSQIEDQIFAKASKEPDIKMKSASFKDKGRRLLKYEIEIPKDQSPEGLKKRKLEQGNLEKEVEDWQSDMARNVASLGQTRRALRITVPEVKFKLASNTALVELIRFNQYLGKTDWETRYGVILISHTNEPVWVALGSATNIEQNLRKYEEVMRGQERGDAAILKILYAQLMEPVVKQLPTNITTLIISPDSQLNFLSFATLVDPQDKFLAESYRIKYVASGRDLVYGRTATNVNPELAVFADPEFNKTPNLPNLIGTNTINLAMLSTDRRDYDGYSLPRLPNSEQEAQFLSSNCRAWHLKPATFTGTGATEAQVKALHSPYILHLATHGFFLPDIQPTNQTRTFQLDQRVPVVLHNPMQRSGLALAGAELTLDAWKRGEVPDTENDGILMADEVAMLDLQNSWLVTLSACDTGIGEARAGEGVLGLRRGFIQAGAQNLLMTLWPVSDKWTVDLMKRFYDEAMRTGNAPDALADVQREYLVKLKKEKNLVFAARLVGPFVMNFQGKP